jgi:hypothetical protein
MPPCYPTGTFEPGEKHDHWDRMARPGRAYLVSQVVECAYEDAGLLAGMAPADAARIESDRPRVFEAKLQLVERLAEAAGRRDASGLWDACLAVLTKPFNAEDVEFYLRMDRLYVGDDARAGLAGLLHPKAMPGGLTNMLEVAGHVEQEITIGLFDRARGGLPAALLQALREPSRVWPGHRWRYFAMLDRPDRGALDLALEETLARAGEEEAFWQNFRHRLREALRSEFRVLVPVEIHPRHVALVGPMVQHVADHLQERRDRGELVVGMPPARNIFRRDGNSWTICFDRRMIAKPDSLGLFYIALLLARPGRILGPSDLRAAHAAYKADPERWYRARAKGAVLVGRGEADEDDPDALGSVTPDLGAAVTEEAEREFRRRCQELEEEIAKASRAGDDHEAKGHRNELEALMRLWTGDRGLGGRPRKLSPAAKRDNDAVRNPIKLVLEDLRQAHPPLWEHLRQWLTVGGQYGYAPRPPVEWDL